MSYNSRSYRWLCWVDPVGKVPCLLEIHAKITAIRNIFFLNGSTENTVRTPIQTLERFLTSHSRLRKRIFLRLASFRCVWKIRLLRSFRTLRLRMFRTTRRRPLAIMSSFKTRYAFVLHFFPLPRSKMWYHRKLSSKSYSTKGRSKLKKQFPKLVQTKKKEASF